jgi:hypothetical protein
MSPESEVTFEQDLVALKKKWIERCGSMLGQLETSLIKEMTEEMTKVVGGRYYEGYCYGCDPGDTKENIKQTVEMFVTNQLIDSAISNDAAGDWDGYPRAENLEEYVGEDEQEDESIICKKCKINKTVNASGVCSKCL